MRAIFIFCILALTTIASKAQGVNNGISVTADTISIKKVSGAYQFYQGDNRLNTKQFKNRVKPNEQAYRFVKSAQTTSAVSTILAYAGGFMIGWPIGTALAGGDPNWAIAGVGAGLIVVAIPIGQKSKKQIRRAVNIYNATFYSNLSEAKTN